MKAYNLKTPNLRTGTAAENRAEIMAYFNRTYALDSKLYETIKADETFYLRADPLRHPLIFYLGHTACFYVNKLLLAKMIPGHINARFESIFAIGVDEMSWDDLDERNYDWPTAAEVRAYRNEVKEMVAGLIETTPLSMPITWEHPFWPILMGIEHQNIHIETSSVLIRQLPLERLQPGIFNKIAHGNPNSSAIAENQLLPVDGGNITLGKPADHRFYGWDLEYGRLKEEVHPFKAARHLVSNGEFLAFVEDNGYQKESLWTQEGWQWRTYKKARMPLFWHQEDSNYKLRLMTHLIDMPWDFPVEVNYLEAKAFCNWKAEKTGKSLRLPTEAEWMQLARTTGACDPDEWQTAPGNINLEHFTSPAPVKQFAFGNFFDVIGNVWQWTETPITGYPGFKVHPLYDDFAVPTFDGQHNLFKGGSWISTGNEATLHARYAFRRHFYQHAGFRYIESNHDPQIITQAYETDVDVARSCELQYGTPIAGEQLLPLRLADIVREHILDSQAKRLLDLNCDTGRMAFALCSDFASIDAVDFSARFINPAVSLQKTEMMRYAFKEEGELQWFVDVQREELGHPGDGDNIAFMQADANNLKAKHNGYDVIVAIHLLTELRHPLDFLAQIHNRLNASGVLILGSDYNWNPEITRRQDWPGGYKKDGEPVYSFEGISAVLSEHFSQAAPPFDLHYTQCLNARNYTSTSLEISIWQKK